MKSVESDWFDHITWRGGRGDQTCISKRGLEKKVLRVAIWKHNTSIFDICFHEPSPSIDRLEVQPSYTQFGGKIQMQRCLN